MKTIDVKKAVQQLQNGKPIIIIDQEKGFSDASIAASGHFFTHDQYLYMRSLEGTANIKFVSNYQSSNVLKSDTQINIILGRFLSTSSNVLEEDMLSCAYPMGVLRRSGHEEAIVDLSLIAELTPCGFLLPLSNMDEKKLVDFAKKNELPIITIASIIKYRRQTESFIKKLGKRRIQTSFGDFIAINYRDTLNNKTHVALVKGDVGSEKVLVRVHSECLTGDIFQSQRCDCGKQLDAALSLINEKGSGILLYMRQEGRGIGLENKIKAYHLQEKGMDTVEANISLGFPPDLREYGVGAQVLVDLGVKSIELMTNNPRKVLGLEGYGITISKRVPIIIEACEYNHKYLGIKEEKLGHDMSGRGF